MHVRKFYKMFQNIVRSTFFFRTPEMSNTAIIPMAGGVMGSSAISSFGSKQYPFSGEMISLLFKYSTNTR